MATLTKPPPCCTARDWETLLALARSPLTAAQLLKVSQTFSLPFPSLKKVRDRLRLLARHRRLIPPLVLQGKYATTDFNALTYYNLSRLGYQLLFGDETPVPASFIDPVALSRQPHTRALADFITHTAVAAERVPVDFTHFSRENRLRLDVAGQGLFPDAAFDLVTPTDSTFSFFVELDNGTEPVVSRKDRDSWERKLRLYVAYQVSSGKKFRVLVVTTHTAERLRHILQLASAVTQNPQRALFYGIRLREYLATPDAVTALCFQDNRGQEAALLPPYHQEASPTGQAATRALVRVSGS